MELQTHELALADALHQPGRLQLFDVMGEGGSAHPMRAAHGTAGRGVLGGADLLEDLEAPRLCQRTRDSRELPFGQPGVPRARHPSKVSLSRPRAQTGLSPIRPDPLAQAIRSSQPEATD